MTPRALLLAAASVVLLSLSGCGGPRPVWIYLLWGSQLQSLGSDFPSEYADRIERNERVTIELRDYATGTPAEAFLERMSSNQEFMDLVSAAQVMTFDWNPSVADSAERGYLRGECGGADNQDCLRAAYNQAKRDWLAVLDRVIELRGGDTSGMRQIAMGTWPYLVHYSSVAPEQRATMVGYFQDMTAFLLDEAERRDIEIVKVFPGEAFEGPPPEDWIHGVGLTTEGDSVIAQALAEIEFENPSE